MAVSLPNDGDMYLIMTADMKYHPIAAAGPCHPTSSASLREKRMISNNGLEKLEYMLLKLIAHFSMS